MPRLAIVTVITALLTAACATSPRAAPGTTPSVSPSDTAAADTGTSAQPQPDTGTAAIRAQMDS